MNTQMDRPRGHTTYGEDPHDHNVGGLQHSGGPHDEHEHPGEKKSVLKKVKAKAKKIKDTLKGHVGHGHDHDEDDDDEDDEMETDPGIHGAPTAQGVGNIIGRQHGTAMEAAVGGVPVSNPGTYQTFTSTTTHNVPEQKETMDWSRTDTGRPLGTEDRLSALKNTPAVGAHSGGSHSTGDLGIIHKGKLGGIIEKDSHVLKDSREDVHFANYEAKVTDPTGRGYGSTAAQSLVPGGGTTRQHGSNLEERGTMEGATHVPVSKPVEYQTFDTSTARYVPGQEETLGWSRTDPGRLEPEEKPFAPRNTPVVAYSGGPHSVVVPETRQKGEYENLGGFLEKPAALEKDPHAPREVGEKCHGENYQSKVIDPTGRGGKEIGITPILHQLGKINIHDDSNQGPTTGQQERLFGPSLHQEERFATGSHNQFSPEPVTVETSSFLQPPDSKSQVDATRSSRPVFHDESGQRQGTYTEKISAAASMVADKAKQATGAVTSKLGYGGSDEHSTAASTVGPLDEQPVHGPLDEKPIPGGYGETLSSVKAAITDTAVHAKDAVASKLGYGGGTREGRPEHIEEASKTGSIGEYGKKVATTVQEKIAPVYEKVAEVGSTVASKVRGTGTEHEAQSTGAPLTTEHEVGSTAAPDKGVSVKEYLVDKLKPGEEDKALSEMITEALPLHKKKEGVSDTAEVEKKVVVIKGKVTESEEVAQSLGRSDETVYDDDVGPGLASPGKSVMDRIYDAAGSWFRKGPGDTGAREHTAEGNNNEISQSSSRGTQQNQAMGEPGLQ